MPSVEEVLERLEAARTRLPALTQRSRETPWERALHPDDDVRLEQLVHEINADLNSLLGPRNEYSAQLLHIFNTGHATLENETSVKSVNRIGATIAAAITHLRTNPPQAAAPKHDDFQQLLGVLSGIHGFARQLERTGIATAPLIRDERTLQSLVHGLLRLHFADVRPEEYSPSYAGGASRIDFLLKSERAAIETKIARLDHADKQIGAELLVDQERYRAHPDCRTLICLIYDPDDHVHNPHGLRNDLEKLSDLSLRLCVVFTPPR